MKNIQLDIHDMRRILNMKLNHEEINEADDLSGNEGLYPNLANMLGHEEDDAEFTLPDMRIQRIFNEYHTYEGLLGYWNKLMVVSVSLFLVALDKAGWKLIPPEDWEDEGE